MRKLIPIIVGLLALGACGGGDDSAATADDALAEATVATSSTSTTAPATTLSADTTVAVEEDDESGAHGEDPGHDDDDSDAAMHDDDGDGSGEAAPGARVIDVSMTDYAFEPSSISVTAGETVTFRISNDGQIVHEFRLSNAHRIEEHLAEGHADHGDDGHHGEADVVLELEAGESGDLTVTFPEDKTFFTEVACLIPGHYEAGMKGVVDYG